MKTKPMAHQVEALQRMNGREYFGLFMDMGTGKTWTFLADAERLYAAGEIEGMLVVAPKGVHTNWVLREIPQHLEVPHIAVAYRSGAGKREVERMNRILRPRAEGEPPPLRVLAINIDALNHKSGFDFALKFMRAASRVLMVVDESDTIKNIKAGRTRAAFRLGHLAAYRRIGTGTPTPQSPLDVFAQMEFLSSGLLGTTSFRAFTAEYAEVLPPENRLVKTIHDRAGKRGPPPQIVARDPITGAPVWRNLDRLKACLLPHTFRVLKSECLDLPPKVYKTVFFDLAPRQRALYDQVERDLRIELAEGDVRTFNGAAGLLKLQQITSGFIVIDGAPLRLGPDAGPRMDALLDVLGRATGQVIVWARFVEELRQIAAALRLAGITFVEYRGETSRDDREAAIDQFQAGVARVFVGQPQSGGIGLTLTAAETVIYYSNDFSSRTRLQSEDRAHRKGTTRPVLYVDIVAEDTVDGAIALAHQRKVSVARQLHDDRALPLTLAEGENQPSVLD